MFRVLSDTSLCKSLIHRAASLLEKGVKIRIEERSVSWCLTQGSRVIFILRE